jgi:transcriptional regulator of acetoin/glycerol metabolism
LATDPLLRRERMTDGAVNAGMTSLIGITWGPNALSNLEREAIRRALEATQGNQTHAAKLLGIQRLALMRAMARHGLETTTQRGRPRGKKSQSAVDTHQS